MTKSRRIKKRVNKTRADVSECASAFLSAFACKAAVCFYALSARIPSVYERVKPAGAHGGNRLRFLSFLMKPAFSMKPIAEMLFPCFFRGRYPNEKENRLDFLCVFRRAHLTNAGKCSIIISVKQHAKEEIKLC